MFTLVLLVSALWLQAQDAGQTAGKTSGLTTIQGCLQYTNGHYRLTEDNGTTHQLQSEANKLTHHVGHEVELTGKETVRTVDTTIQGAASSVKEQPVFKVSSVKHVADTCTSAGH
jgi:ABC-type transport system involved in cytochrome c biogenesis ATPase subunit